MGIIVFCLKILPDCVRSRPASRSRKMSANADGLASLPLFPSLDMYCDGTSSLMEASRATAPLASKSVKAPKVPSLLGKRGPIQPLPNGGGKRPTPLDQLGDSALRSRDHFGHLTASLKAHMSGKQLRATGLENALLELQATVAKDMKQQRDETWRRGVTHGEWLKEGECRLNTQSAAAAENLRQQVFDLEMKVLHLKRDLAAADIKNEASRRKISELSCRIATTPEPAPPPPAPEDTAETMSIEELIDSGLFDEEGVYSPISQPPLSPDSYGTLSPT